MKRDRNGPTEDCLSLAQAEKIQREPATIY